MSMQYISEILPSLFQGAALTLQIFFWTLVGSLPLGILVSLGLTSKIKPLKWVLEIYVWLMRGTPLLLQLIFVFYGLPIIGIVFERYDAALVAFILNYAAYFAEIFRGGFQSVDQGQFEAARVLRLSYWQTLRKIIIPQVIKIVYVIGLGDLLRAGNVATSRDVTLVPLMLVGLIYLILVGICTLILRQVEKCYAYFK